MKRTIYLFSVFFLIFSLIGCDAFVRKFTRKSNKDKMPPEEMVLAPEEFKGPNMTKEEQYRQYFLFWKSWQDELITALAPDRPALMNQKKLVDCVEQAVKNLACLKPFLKEQMQKKVDVYLQQLADLKEALANDFSSANLGRNRMTAERIRRDILRDLSFPGIKKYILV